jgi:hypothetical protein
LEYVGAVFDVKVFLKNSIACVFIFIKLNKDKFYF